MPKKKRCNLKFIFLVSDLKEVGTRQHLILFLQPNILI